ncbi:cytoskeleton-associated protein 4-like [Erpetoichthys calabaricus]|uniref:Cytoskeleton-associated protein 4 n=1 Tax=Erpetoichthys calabaricus TaxID=27687 RepID=A0A8C4S9Y0_ERPCA|nr:cytoskeleton-associated protein 4-like [Erpetoichthys calabaricus]
MSSVKQRNKHNVQEKTSHTSFDDVAKKNSKGSKGGASPGPGIWGKLLSVLLYLSLMFALGFTGFYLLQVTEQINRISALNEASEQRSQEALQKAQNVLQQVDSVKITVGTIDSSLKDTKKELDVISKAVRKGETETMRIEEVLEKLQKEILQDLSDGIQDVKEGRKKDFSSLEQTLEERLTELTKSINDNVSLFTEVQGATQRELQNIKMKIDAVEDLSLLKYELQQITTTVADLHNTVKVQEEMSQSFTNQISSLQSEVQTRNVEVVSTVQEFEELKGMVQGTANSLKQALADVQASVQSLSEAVQKNQKDLEQVTSGLGKYENMILENPVHAANIEGSESRLKGVEDTLEGLQVSHGEHLEKIESILSKYDGHDSNLASLARDVENLKKSDTEAQEVISRDLEELKKDMASLRSAVTSTDPVNEISSLNDEHKQQIKNHEDRLVKVEGIIGRNLPEEGSNSKEADLSELKSSIGQTKNDLQILRTAVDSLVAYSVKIETNGKELASLRDTMDKMKSAVDILALKFEQVLEKV